MFLVLSCSCRFPIHWSQVLSQEWRCSWSNVSTGDAPTTSEWSARLLPTKMCLILEIWMDFKSNHYGLVTPYGEKDVGHYWFWQWLVAWRPKAITKANIDLSSVKVLCHSAEGSFMDMFNFESHKVTSTYLRVQWVNGILLSFYKYFMKVRNCNCISY